MSLRSLNQSEINISFEKPFNQSEMSVLRSPFSQEYQFEKPHQSEISVLRRLLSQEYQFEKPYQSEISGWEAVYIGQKYQFVKPYQSEISV